MTSDRSAELIRTACEIAGVDDFGGDSFRPGLEQLVQSLDDEAALHDLAKLTIDGMIVGHLLNRLRVTAWLRDHPAVLGVPVDRPVFIVGLPRTGTTLLHYLLGQDPRFRTPMSWEVLESVPPPRREAFSTDKRVAHTRDAKAVFRVLNPGFEAIHHEAPDGPTECLTVLSQDFKSIFWETVADIPSYGAWLRTADLGSTYEYHRRLLQLLQSEAPGRWLLKCPAHLLGLGPLLTEYPDALFVMTHRDPVTVVASMCSLVASLSGTFSAADHRASIVRRWSEIVEEMVDRSTEARSRDPELDRRFLDIGYQDLVEDPMGTVRRIYAHVGAELEPEVESSMHRYLLENPQGRYGTHVYDPVDLGLDVDDLRERFGAYRTPDA